MPFVTQPGDQTKLTELRRKAERQLGRLFEQITPSLAPENVTALVHELQVHQIELEMQCHELQRAQEEAEESRDRYRELYESIPVGYVTIDDAGRIYDMNPASTRLLKLEAQRQQPHKHFFVFFQNGGVNAVTLFCRKLPARQEPDMCEFSMKKADGSPFTAALQAVPVAIGEGKGKRLRVSFQDITGRKEAEEQLRRQQAQLEANEAELRELTRRLFTAQEEERKRIARELHDDHCQRVTTLILDANMLRKACEKEASQLAPRLTAMSHNLSAILSEFRAFSHELPRNLGERALAGPIRDLVKEFNGKAGFKVEFIEQAVPAKIPPDTMTTIFRLLQESLSNITKHANATHVTVTLAGTGQGAELVVVDDGSGFDTARAWDGQKGMGMVGMRERVRLVGGTIKIISQPGQGTTIIFSIPLSE